MTRSNGIGQEQEFGEYVHVIGDHQEPLKSDFGNAHERGPDGAFRSDANLDVSVQEDGVMRFVPTSVHAAMDYPMAILTMASPWLFGFRRGGMETWVPVAVGGMALLTNAMTDHELGLKRMVPMRLHATLDVMNGAMLAASPWLFGFSKRTMLPHLILGVLDVASGLTVKTRPSLRHRRG